MHKLGEMTIGQIAKLILAVAVVIILLMLVVRLFAPVFDVKDETAKSYFESLEREIKLADSEEGGEFFMWYLGDSDREYYLVYFGKTIGVDILKKVWGYDKPVGMGTHSKTLEDKNILFNSLGRNSNRICICSMDGNKDKGYESTCKYCEDLDYPVSFVDKGETWYEKGGSRISIELDKLKGDKYVFARVE